jgi:hypothetical protein
MIGINMNDDQIRELVKERVKSLFGHRLKSKAREAAGGNWHIFECKDCNSVFIIGCFRHTSLDYNIVINGHYIVKVYDQIYVFKKGDEKFYCERIKVLL